MMVFISVRADVVNLCSTRVGLPIEINLRMRKLNYQLFSGNLISILPVLGIHVFLTS